MIIIVSKDDIIKDQICSSDESEDDDQEEQQEDTPEDTTGDALEIVKNLDDFMELSRGLGRSLNGWEEITDENTPKGFVSFERNGDEVIFRKSTLLWMVTMASTKVSSDRLHRFEDSGEKTFDKAGNIRIGDSIRINWKNNLMICSVLAFKFQIEVQIQEQLLPNSA